MQNDNPTCPDCDSEMVLRKNRETGEEFWGCSRYPECRGTERKDPEQETHEELPTDRYRRADRQRWRQ